MSTLLPELEPAGLEQDPEVEDGEALLQAAPEFLELEERLPVLAANPEPNHAAAIELRSDLFDERHGTTAGTTSHGNDRVLCWHGTHRGPSATS